MHLQPSNFSLQRPRHRCHAQPVTVWRSDCHNYQPAKMPPISQWRPILSAINRFNIEVSPTFQTVFDQVACQSRPCAIQPLPSSNLLWSVRWATQPGTNNYGATLYNCFARSNKWRLVCLLRVALRHPMLSVRSIGPNGEISTCSVSLVREANVRCSPEMIRSEDANRRYSPFTRVNRMTGRSRVADL